MTGVGALLYLVTGSWTVQAAEAGAGVSCVAAGGAGWSESSQPGLALASLAILTGLLLLADAVFLTVKYGLRWFQK